MVTVAKTGLPQVKPAPVLLAVWVCLIPSDCAPGGWCYAASGHPAVLQTQPKLKCRTRLQVDETETGISDPYCTLAAAQEIS